jgi:hypothetical protein
LGKFAKLRPDEVIELSHRRVLLLSHMGRRKLKTGECRRQRLSGVDPIKARQARGASLARLALDHNGMVEWHQRHGLPSKRRDVSA